MRTFAVSVVVTAAVLLSGCGATRRVVAPGATVTGATITFVNQGDGKDAKSAVDAWLLRDSNEIAHLHEVGTHFNDHTSTAPMAMSVSGAFHQADLGEGQLRVRLTPDGKDTWMFDPRLTVTFSDGTSRSYMWTGLQLDNNNPERTLSLSSAVQVP